MVNAPNPPESQEQEKRVSLPKKILAFIKDDDIYWKVLVPVLLGIVSTAITTYVSNQSRYDQVINDYMTTLKEYVISERLNLLTENIKSLNGRIDEIEKIKKNINNKCKNNEIESKCIEALQSLDGLFFSFRRKDLDENLTLNYAKISDEDEIKPLRILLRNIRACSDEDCPKITTENKEKILKLINLAESRFQKELDESEALHNQAKELMGTATSKVLITLSRDTSFLGCSKWLIVQWLPFCKNTNITRRDIIVNALRNAELGIGNRVDGISKYPNFLDDIEIGSYTKMYTEDGRINLNRVDFADAKLKSVIFNETDFINAVFNFAEISESIFAQNNLSYANFSGANISSTVFGDSKMIFSDFNKANIIDTKFSSPAGSLDCRFGARIVDMVKPINEINTISDIPKAINKMNTFKSKNIICKTDLTQADFEDAVIQNTAFFNVIMGNIKFNKAFISNVNFSKESNLNLKDSDILKSKSLILKSVVLPSGEKIDKMTVYNHMNQEKIPCCESMIFSYRNFKNATLKEAKFSWASLNRIYFKGADLSGTNFKYATIIDSNLENTNLTNSKFNNSNLRGVKFKGANLTDANFNGATGIDFDKLKNEDAIMCRTTSPSGEIISINCQIGN